MNKYTERLYNGIWKENPIFVQMLGLCPTLAVTTSAMNGLGMGLSSTVVLIAANFIISLMRSIIPGRVRLPGEIVIVASLVTIVDMLMEGFTPSLYSALGIYIPLIVVNCIDVYKRQIMIHGGMWQPRTRRQTVPTESVRKSRLWYICLLYTSSRMRHRRMREPSGFLSI